MAVKAGQKVEEEADGIPVEPLERAGEGEGTTVPPEPQSTPATVRAGENLFTEDEVNKRIEAARQQEKDKLYSRLETQEQTLSKLNADLERREAAEAEAKRQAEEAQAAKDREEMSAKELLDQRQAEWENRFVEMQREREADRALIAREAQFQELAGLRAQLIAEANAEGETIAPQLLDYVGGASADEIRQSIAMAQQKTADIVAEVQTAQQRQRQGMKGASVTQPPVGPMETDQVYETLTPDDITNMSMADYAKNRPKLLAAASRARNNGAR